MGDFMLGWMHPFNVYIRLGDTLPEFDYMEDSLYDL